MTRITIPELRQLCLDALTATGLPAEEAALTADHYLENELSGKTSHGMVRVVEACQVLRKHGLPSRKPGIVQDSGSLAVMDAYGNPGPVAGHYLVRLAAARAKEHGIAFTAIRNYIANSGAMAYYLRRFADEGLTAIMSCNSFAMVSAPGGSTPLVGTNPIGLAAPGENAEHFIADFATSAIAYGKMMVMKEKGLPLPAGVLNDAQGQPSTNPDDALNGGAIKPLADYRGFALALMVEILAGPLIGAAACKRTGPGQDGLFAIVIDPGKLGRAPFARDVTPLLDLVRQSAPVPGDRSLKTLRETHAQGIVDVADTTLQKLRAL